MVDYVLIFTLLQSFYGAVSTAACDKQSSSAEGHRYAQRAGPYPVL